MTEMKISKNTFYVFKAEGDEWLYDNKVDAVSKLKAALKTNADMDAVGVYEVNTEEENWKIKQIGWKDIVKELL